MGVGRKEISCWGIKMRRTVIADAFLVLAVAIFGLTTILGTGCHSKAPRSTEEDIKPRLIDTELISETWYDVSGVEHPPYKFIVHRVEIQEYWNGRSKWHRLVNEYLADNKKDMVFRIKQKAGEDIFTYFGMSSNKEKDIVLASTEGTFWVNGWAFDAIAPISIPKWRLEEECFQEFDGLQFWKEDRVITQKIMPTTFKEKE